MNILKINKTYSYILIILVIIALVIHVYLSFYDSPGFWTDSFIYLLQADYFSIWLEEKSAVLDQSIAYRNFPPLYPIFLGLLNAGSNNILLANIVTSLLLFPVSYCYVLWQKEQGLDDYLCWTNALLFLIFPATLLLSTEIWSENLYLLFVFLSLWSYQKAESNNKWFYPFSMFCGLALLSRTVSVSLVFTFIFLLIRKSTSRTIIFIAIVLIPWLTWRLLTLDVEFSSNYISHGLVQRYTNIISGSSEFSDVILSTFLNQVKAFWLAIQLQFDYKLNFTTNIVTGLLVLSTLYSLVIRLHKLKPDAIYVAIYLTIIFVWNFPDQNVRFMYVVMPFFLFYVHYSLLKIFKDTNIKKILGLSFIILILVSVMPGLLILTERAMNAPNGYVKRSMHDRIWLSSENPAQAYRELVYKESLVDAAINIKSVVSEDECVYSIYPELIMLYGQRKSLSPPFDFVGQKEFENGLTDCAYLFVIGSEHKLHAPLYPIDRVRDSTWVIQQKHFPEEMGSELISILLELDRDILK